MLISARIGLLGLLALPLLSPLLASCAKKGDAQVVEFEVQNEGYAALAGRRQSLKEHDVTVHDRC